MSVTINMPKVLNCGVESCSYNRADQCAAAAVTIGQGDKASCATFIPLGVKGGLDRVTSFVGACTRSDCVFNEKLECTAESVRIGADSAECMTYQAR